MRCPLSVHRDHIIGQFLLAAWHSPMFDRWPTSDVLFLFIGMRSLSNVSEHHSIRQCLVIDRHPMSFCCSSRWDHWTISLIIIPFANVWSLTSIWCPFSLRRDQIIEHFRSAAWHSAMFDHLPTADVLFLVIEMRALNNFSYDEDIRECLIIDQHPMWFFSSSTSDHWIVSLIIITFAKIWLLTNIRCSFLLHWDEIIEQFLLPS